LSLGAKGAQKAKEPAKEQTQAEDAPVSIDTFSAQDPAAAATARGDKPSPSPAAASPAPSAAPTKISLGGLMGKKSNPLMGKKPNALAGKKPVAAPEPEKKMSNAERIMREEMERKRFNDGRGGGGKRQRLG
jgi:DNA/RNA-binding protein KIN17